MSKLENFKQKVRNDGFILWATFHFFDLLRDVSLFQQIRIFAKKRWDAKFKKAHPGATEEERSNAWSTTKPFTHTYVFPELWAFLNIFLALIGCILITYISSDIPAWCFIIYAILRMLELFVYQVNVLLFDPIKSINENKQYRIKSATRTILLLICNIFEYVLWFSVIYIFLFKQDNPEVDKLRIVLESITTLANVASPDDMSRHSYLTITIIAYIESIVGIFMNIICLARFISLLPSVESIDK